MKSEKIGNVQLYISPEAEQTPQTPGQADRQLQEIVSMYREHEYHSRITACKSWTVMYQLAESRANIIEWLEIPKHAKVLEIGAGCGTVTSALRIKGARLTCQEENLHYCRLNAMRQEKAMQETDNQERYSWETACRGLRYHCMPGGPARAGTGGDFSGCSETAFKAGRDACAGCEK